MGKEYTYECSTVKLAIDLILLWNLKTGLKGWKVSKELNHSDHNTIKYTLETKFETIPLHRPWSKADWKLLREELEKKKYTYPRK